MGNVDETFTRSESSGRPDLEQALMQLGLKSFEAKTICSQMLQENEKFAGMKLPELLQTALKYIGRSRNPSDRKVDAGAGV